MEFDAYIILKNGKKYTGKTIWSIIRRVYGKSKNIYLETAVEPGPRSCGPCRIRRYYPSTGRRRTLGNVAEFRGPLGVDNNGTDRNSSKYADKTYAAECAKLTWEIKIATEKLAELKSKYESRGAGRGVY